MPNIVKRSVCCGLTAVCLLALTGCESMLNRSMYNVKLHVERTVEYDDTDSVEITDPAMLLRVLREQVRAGADKVTLRFSNFGGHAAVVTAVTEACEELVYDAYGRFVELYMIPDVKDNLATVSISYRRSGPREEVEALRNVSSFARLQTELQAAIRTFSPYTALELRYGAAEDLNPAEMLEAYYLQAPLHALGLPRITSTFYRGDRASVILELRLEFIASKDTLTVLQDAVSRRAGELAETADAELSPPELALLLHDVVCGYIEYDHEEAARAAGAEADRLARPYSMLGAMQDGRAVGEGYALAYKALCDAFNIPCEVIIGHLAGNIHAWNAIELDGDWYLVDAAMNGQGSEISHAFFLGNDEAWLDARYTWDAARYPKCEAGVLTYEAIAEGRNALGPETNTDGRSDAEPEPELE